MNNLPDIINSQTLSIDKINAGEDFVFEFNKIIPVSSAFWLKITDEQHSYLYIASEKINDSNFDSAYTEVLLIAKSDRMKCLDPFKIKVIGSEDPLSKAAMDFKHFSSTKTIGIRLEGCTVGNVFADEIYIYPDVNELNKMISDKLDNTIENSILELEKHVKNPAGTSLTRVLFHPVGRGWSLGIGQMSTPLHLFTGDTIESVVSQAEEHLKKYNQF